MKKILIILLLIPCFLAAEYPQLEKSVQNASTEKQSANNKISSSWTSAQIMKLKNITAVRVSPDGKQVLYAVREAVMTDDRSEYINQLYLVDANGKNTRQLTKGDRNYSNPKWSPRGQQIAFTSNRDGKNNLYILSLNEEEAKRLTDVKTGVNDFEWSPNGDAIAYSMNDPLSDTEEKNKKAKDDWYFMDEGHKYSRLYVLWLNEKDSAGKRKILKLTKDNRNISAFNWSPDGKWIAYQHAQSPKIGDNMLGDLAMVNLNTGQVKDIVSTKGGESKPMFSPDGKSIAYISLNGSIGWDGKFVIKIIPVSGGKPITIATPDEYGGLLGWSADGQYVYAYEPYHTRSKVFRLRADGKGISEWTKESKEMISAIDLNDNGTYFGMVMQSVTKPGDVYVSSVAEFLPVKISTLNPQVEALPIPKTELIKWKSLDGTEIEGLLTYPLHYETGKRYPLVLNIHGGPDGVFDETFIARNNERYPITSFSEDGIFVLRANPRGSIGYGVKFRLPILRDWGGVDYKDLMAGVDYTIAKGWVDSSKLALMGWSYGGFMSSWIICHTNRFKAASIGAPVVELVSQTFTDDFGEFVPVYMNAYAWEDWDVYDLHSPLRYVQNITTPVLLQHGEVDVKVPFSQSVMFYNALKKRGVPVRFLALPRQPHGPYEPKMVLKKRQTNLEWIEHYLIGKPLSF